MNRVILVGIFDVEKRKDWEQDVVKSRKPGEKDKFDVVPVWIPGDISRPKVGDSIWAEGTLFENANRFLVCRITRWQSKNEYSRRISEKTGAHTPSAGDDVPF